MKKVSRQRLSQLRNPEKEAARKAATSALKAGRIRRQPCAECGAEPAEMHHEDYSQPLAVVFLCKKHHLAKHTRKNRPLTAEETKAAATLSKAVRHYVVDHEDLDSMADLARSLGWAPSTFYVVLRGAEASKPLMEALLGLDPSLPACAECGRAGCEAVNDHPCESCGKTKEPERCGIAPPLCLACAHDSYGDE